MRAQTTEERQDFNQGHIAQLASSHVVGNNHDLKEAGITKQSVANWTQEMEETYLGRILWRITLPESLYISHICFPLSPHSLFYPRGWQEISQKFSQNCPELYDRDNNGLLRVDINGACDNE